MKVVLCLVVAASLGVVLGEAPNPDQGRNGPGAFLILPSRQVQGTFGQPVPTNYGPPQGEQDEPQVADDAAEVNKTMERLRQKEGSETGVYYVLLPDGRLQRIQYTTAPLKQQEEENQSYKQQGSDQKGFNYKKRGSGQNEQKYYQQGTSQKEQTLKGHYVLVQPQMLPENQASGQYNQQADANTSPKAEGSNQEELEAKEPNKFVAEFGRARIVMMPNPPASYVASVQYSDVDPITDPVYSYNAAPLVRILRRA